MLLVRLLTAAFHYGDRLDSAICSADLNPSVFIFLFSRLCGEDSVLVEDDGTVSQAHGDEARPAQDQVHVLPSSAAVLEDRALVPGMLHTYS